MTQHPDSVGLMKALYAQGPQDLEDGPYLSTGINDAFINYRHMFPELISYRGGLFVEANFDKTTVDEMFDMARFGGGASAVADAEAQINSIGLCAEAVEAGDLAAAQASAEAIGWVWKRWIKETYDVEIEVVAHIGDEDSWVTFRSAGAG
ncbi:hypothetical protein ACO2Q1_12855 [Brevundimonas sp. VNH65]|uniref:hypothetical protein n=1 Tax=Brevundimonas sp. VNH65 TaxID=3400917 RepID=UPI003BFE1B54